MITYVYDDIFTSPATVLVNTVNTVGVMGKGIAKEFKRLFPDMFKMYQQRCERGDLRIGSLFLYHGANKSVLNFPTKKHWRSPSRIEYIEEGLRTFVASYEQWGIDSIAYPQLGCGNGELDWKTQVKPVMERHLKGLPIRVYIHIADRSTEVPEHRDPKWMKAWINSEPESLPAHEVWTDLLDAVRFDPDVRGWSAAIVSRQVVLPSAEDTRDVGSTVEAILLSRGPTEVLISQEGILPIWRQLTTLGLASGDDFPPSIKASEAPLLDLFLRLEYLQPVQFTPLDSNGKERVHGIKLLPRVATPQRQLELVLA